MPQCMRFASRASHCTLLCFRFCQRAMPQNLRHFMLFNANESRQHQQTRHFPVARTPSITHFRVELCRWRMETNGRNGRIDANGHAERTDGRNGDGTRGTHGQRASRTQARTHVTHSSAHARHARTRRSHPQALAEPNRGTRHFSARSKCDAIAFSPCWERAEWWCVASLDVAQSCTRSERIGVL